LLEITILKLRKMKLIDHLIMEIIIHNLKQELVIESSNILFSRSIKLNYNFLCKSSKLLPKGMERKQHFEDICINGVQYMEYRIFIDKGKYNLKTRSMRQYKYVSIQL